MGYRPEFTDVEDPELCFYGTKLYGYTDPSKLESCKYLIKLGKVEDPDSWFYEDPNEMILTAEQFKTFIDLYEKDYNREREPYKLCDHEDYWIIQSLINRDTSKHIEWF